ncbi:hypothetical protein [Nostoc sp.]|uniref:hypothetical protein n=1 Tax=Nostoc sp. TaxID=1180 RepID=UPI002FF9C659
MLVEAVYRRIVLTALSTAITASDLLTETLNYNLAIALGSNSEKARSELIIAPILVDLRRTVLVE